MRRIAHVSLLLQLVNFVQLVLLATKPVLKNFRLRAGKRARAASEAPAGTRAARA
ncbi:hypothetical protein QRD40_14310 [Comamonas sp. Y6]|uniref:Uncharacterized protein n=1 Tax=Comamonas resistens TaxID=3046670 RepID=A0ABY8SMX8_9BURK|nr:hypothetical protein [Comamonas resistens]MDL5037521.1 hypothetical protein [Comamonas resistens]WHS64437.1 hypothetical protein QMY55_18315 [Comamonas resistens]